MKQAGCESFAEFASTRWQGLFRFAYLLTNNAADAEDCVQVALSNAYARWPRIERLEHPDAYVRKVVVNTFLSGRRRHRVHVVPEGWAPEPERPSHEDTSVDRLDVLHAVALLPPRQRAVILLRFYSDASEQEAAEALGCSRGTVKSQTSDALRNLRRLLDADSHHEGTPS
jgi:RNA polymerase sigma-70 factor (sigma-E family)